MTVDVKKAISSAVVHLLRPLIKILLRNGIPYGAFCELARWAYVDVASKDFSIPGKKQTISRVAILTGLSRKEVSRIQEISGPDDMGASDRYNRAVRVIGGWRNDPRFLDETGAPLILPFEEGAVNFSLLVKAHSGDVPARAVLDEMLRAGVVELDDGKIRLLNRGYIVRSGEIEKINILGTDAAELMSTIDHNLTCDGDGARLQRKISYDNIPDSVLDELRLAIRKKSEAFVESMDRLISRYDRDTNPSLRGEGRRKAGLGLYYFE